MSISDLISDLGGWAGLLAVLSLGIRFYLKWRSEIVFIKPSILTELQDSLDKALATLDMSLERNLKLEKEMRRSRKECAESIAALEERLSKVERVNGNGI